ncbi:hypothetical protein NDU88_009376 [Pleurodeles waltl]|uniref:Uncharacterized protein n=1 Tax=Pleurodeles waltl TaxID=8319 RepID=A0AAV7S075_PLEWA|nr:hypothetical protein NDU88_009376 [Pleurodeles waltl]
MLKGKKCGRSSFFIHPTNRVLAACLPCYTGDEQAWILHACGRSAGSTLGRLRELPSCSTASLRHRESARWSQTRCGLRKAVSMMPRMRESSGFQDARMQESIGFQDAEDAEVKRFSKTPRA